MLVDVSLGEVEVSVAAFEAVVCTGVIESAVVLASVATLEGEDSMVFVSTSVLVVATVLVSELVLLGVAGTDSDAEDANEGVLPVSKGAALEAVSETPVVVTCVVAAVELDPSLPCRDAEATELDEELPSVELETVPDAVSCAEGLGPEPDAVVPLGSEDDLMTPAFSASTREAHLTVIPFNPALGMGKHS